MSKHRRQVTAGGFMGAVALAAAWLLATPSWAGTTSHMGRQLNFQPPEGFCAIGGNAKEDELLAKIQPTGGAGELVSHFVPCDELKAMRAGLPYPITLWGQLVVDKSRTPEQLKGVSRAEWTAAMADALSESQVQIPAKAERELNAGLSIDGFDQELRMSEMKVFGVEGDVTYFGIKTNMRLQNKETVIVGLSGATLVNDLGVVLTVFAVAQSTPKDRPMQILRSSMRSMMAAN